MTRKLATWDDVARCTRVYGSLRILRDGRLRFSAQPGRDPSLSYAAMRVHGEGNGVYIYDSSNYSVDVRLNQETVLFLVVNRSRVRAATVPFLLEPRTLRAAVRYIRAEGNGVERWLAPGLERTLWDLKRGHGNPALLNVIPGLLRSLQDIPRPVPPVDWSTWDETMTTAKTSKAGTTQPRKAHRS